MAVYTFLSGPGKYANVIQHLEGMGIELVSSALSQGVYTIETDSPIPQEQLEHLEIAEA